MSNLSSLRRLLLISSLLVSGFAHAADTGHVTRSIGDAKIVRGETQVKATAGVVVKGGDEVRTGADGQVYWMMADDSKFAIRKDSRFEINSFSTPKTQSPGKAIYSMIKGAFRTVSGLIGKTRADTYEVNTPVATIGIRGTDYAAVLHTGDSAHASGLYFHVYKGTIFVKNEGGIAEFTEGQSGYVANKKTKAVLVNNVDDIFDRYSEGSIFEDAFGSSEINFPNLGFNVPGIDIQLQQRIEPPTLPPIPSREVPASPS